LELIKYNNDLPKQIDEMVGYRIWWLTLGVADPGSGGPKPQSV